MAKGENQKLKILYIAKYLYEKTDEQHCVSTTELIKMLAQKGCTAERKSIYSDIEALQSFGMDIQITKGRNGGFALLSRSFQLTELKILTDAVQSSRFITKKKSYALIQKLQNLASVHDRSELSRDIFLTNRIKNENESIYYTVDVIYAAIRSDSQIAFLYFNYGADKRKHYHNNKEPIRVSPFGLQFDSEKYYLIAFDPSAGKIKHYRVDKMNSADILPERREGKGYFRKFDLAAYANATVEMFSGKPADVTLKCPNEIAGAVIDKFGKKCKFIPTKDGEYTVMIRAALTPTLYSWIFTFGGKLKILAPPEAMEAYKTQLLGALDTVKK